MSVAGPSKTRTDFMGAADERRRSMQAAFTDLLASVGLTGARPAEVGRSLGLDKTLAWKVSRLVHSSDPVETFRHMPGPAGIEIVLRAAGEKLVQDDVLGRVRRAYQELQAFVDQHAGDRRTFEAMLAGNTPDPGGEFDERRAYFRSGSAMWGVRAKVQFLMLALKPSESRPGHIDVAQVGGLVNLERLRADVPWIVRRLRAHTDTGGSLLPAQRVPLVAERAEKGLPPLFDRYCSEPLPELRQFKGSDGWVYDELAPGSVGRAGATTVVLGERYVGALPLDRSEDNTRGVYLLTVRTPVECVLFDLLLHRDLAHFGRPTRGVYGLLEGRPAVPPNSQSGERPSTLMAPAPATELGSSAVVHTHRMPSYPAMVESALELAGFGGLESFRGYRAEIEYPAFPCDVRLALEIAARV